jgi:hypothetical protein
MPAANARSRLVHRLRQRTRLSTVWIYHLLRCGGEPADPRTARAWRAVLRQVAAESALSPAALQAPAALKTAAAPATAETAAATGVPEEPRVEATSLTASHRSAATPRAPQVPS